MRRIGLLCFCLYVCFFPCMAQGAAPVEVREYGTNVEQNPYKGRTQTYVDPQSGDRVTTVRPKRQPKNANTNTAPDMPIYVFPQVVPGQVGGHVPMPLEP